MDNFLNLAKKGYEAYSESQQSKNGGSSPSQNQGGSQGYGNNQSYGSNQNQYGGSQGYGNNQGGSYDNPSGYNKPQSPQSSGNYNSNDSSSGYNNPSGNSYNRPQSPQNSGYNNQGNTQHHGQHHGGNSQYGNPQNQNQGGGGGAAQEYYSGSSGNYGNSPSSGNNQGYGNNQEYGNSQGYGNSGRPDSKRGWSFVVQDTNFISSLVDHDEALKTAEQHGSGDKSLFSTALSFVNKQDHGKPINEQDVADAHQKAYGGGNASSLNASSLGSAAAMHVLQQFMGGKNSGNSGSSGGSSTQLISMAMAEATKLFDKSGGAASGNKQDAVNGAAATVMTLLVQSKLSGLGGSAPTTGGSNSGGLGSLLSLVSFS
ncbi:hypothetical protein H0H81_007436 [Sphagnurus paluster]|uniref:DUF7721 domain-containing protein n=1 Tax=Sphagnurus paluster TaxID=117069 RepID=A0A9P7GSN4_9AGAR|nr:hypothetical protein H0H81_007436 [Sphagnurus paluster]